MCKGSFVKHLNELKKRKCCITNNFFKKNYFPHILVKEMGGKAAYFWYGCLCSERDGVSCLKGHCADCFDVRTAHLSSSIKIKARKGSWADCFESDLEFPHHCSRWGLSFRRGWFAAFAILILWLRHWYQLQVRRSFTTSGWPLVITRCILFSTLWNIRDLVYLMWW